MKTINWDLCPDATHFSHKLDDSGMFCDVFWKIVDDKAVCAWRVDEVPMRLFHSPTFLDDDMARLIARPTPEQDAAKREAAIQDLTNLMLENPDLNQYFLARLIIDAGYSKKEAP